MAQMIPLDDAIPPDCGVYAGDTKKKKKGWFISRTKAVLFLAISVVVVIIVGVVVYYVSTSGRGNSCHITSKTEDQGSLSSLTTIQPTAATTNEPSSSPGAHVDIRLPRNLIPSHYQLKLKPEFDYSNNTDDFHFHGHVNIHFRCSENTSSVTLHSKDLNIENGSVNLTQLGQADDVHQLTLNRFMENKELELLILFFDEPLISGNEYVLQLKFKGPLKDDLVGLYLSSNVQGNVTKRLLASQMEPTSARKVLPCFDEPEFKATFEVTIVRKSHMKSLSNMPIEMSLPIDGGWVEDRFNRTPVPMSTYLLAFSVFDGFKYLENFTKSGIKFRVYAREALVSNAEYALEVGIKILDFFEEYFNINYPLPKLDMMAVPDFAAGAMENWGLIMYKERALLYDPQSSSLSDKIYVATVVAHELAHQWFGNLVSPRWWNDLWLNEGFASYLEYTGMEHAQPDWNVWDMFILNDLQSVLLIDSFSSSLPIRRPISTTQDIESAFDTITYSKGASIIRMMQYFIGEMEFLAGLRNYLRRHQYSSATLDDLWSAMTDKIEYRFDVNVSRWMNTWLKQPGYPVVSVRLTSDDGRLSRIHLNQERFLVNETIEAGQVDDQHKHPSRSRCTWIIPFTFALSTRPNWTNPQHVWILTDNVSLPAGNEAWNESTSWIIGNIGQFGYYRVNYEPENWKQLATQLKADHSVIPVKNRAQMIDDAFQIAQSGAIDQVVALRLTEYLDRETEYVPWMSAISNLRYISTMLDRSPGYGHLEEYILTKLVSHYNRLGWEVNDGSSPNARLLRSEILRWTCFHGHRPCLVKAFEMYANWMNSSGMNSIAGDLRRIIYCTGIMEGGRREWDFAYQQYQAASDADEKKRLIEALACTRSPWLLSRYLNYTWERIRRQDVPQVYSSIAQNPIGRLLAWNFFRQRWKCIRDRFSGGIFLLKKMVKAVPEAFNTDTELKQLRDFEELHLAEMGSAGKTLKLAVEKTRLNIKWMERNEDAISRWFQDRNEQRSF